ncbi:uncharacterized [Tachysurus ichikawai]
MSELKSSSASSVEQNEPDVVGNLLVIKQGREGKCNIDVVAQDPIFLLEKVYRMDGNFQILGSWVMFQAVKSQTPLTHPAPASQQQRQH